MSEDSARRKVMCDMWGHVGNLIFLVGRELNSALRTVLTLVSHMGSPVYVMLFTV